MNSLTKNIIAASTIFLTSLTATAASFNCAKASTPIEIAICKDNVLSTLDEQLLQAYRSTQASISDANRLKNDQNEWLRDVRGKCVDVTCLRQVYRNRIDFLLTSYKLSQNEQSPELLVDKNSLYETGLKYYNKNDLKQAFKYILASAEMGHLDAQSDIGIMYDSGDGVEKNPNKALEWFKKGAANGSAKAQHNLGAIYLNGENGVSKNWDEAKKWYSLAASKGYQPSIETIKQMNAKERSVKNVSASTSATVPSQRSNTSDAIGYQLLCEGEKPFANLTPYFVNCASGDSYAKAVTWAWNIIRTNKLIAGKESLRRGFEDSCWEAAKNGAVFASPRYKNHVGLNACNMGLEWVTAEKRN